MGKSRKATGSISFPVASGAGLVSVITARVAMITAPAIINPVVVLVVCIVDSSGLELTHIVKPVGAVTAGHDETPVFN